MRPTKPPSRCSAAPARAAHAGASARARGRKAADKRSVFAQRIRQRIRLRPSARRGGRTRLPGPRARCSAGALASLSAAVALSQSRLPALLALVALALGQAYFGLSLPAAAQLLLLFMLGLKLVPSRSAVQRLALGACALAVAPVVCLAFPGVHRDGSRVRTGARLFSGASLSEQADAAAPPEATQTRRENHLSLSTGGGGAVSERDYRLVTRAEEQISDPPWFDALKTVLMLALVVLLLALPFAPFMLAMAR